MAPKKAQTVRTAPAASTRSVRLSTGSTVPLDGDLLAIIEALYQEVTLGNVLNSSFETMRSEILTLIDQMNPTERRNYLAESLFLNSVTYENEMLSAYVRRLAAPPKASSARPKVVRPGPTKRKPR
jgi:predicted DNA-binding helix-hairpin-helix protein